MTRKFHSKWLFVFVLFIILVSDPAYAHQGISTYGGFLDGIKHPIYGYDHLLAMLAVGIWGAQMGGSSVWSLPVTFPLIMAVGGFLGIIEVPIPQVEPAIALSVLVLGLVILAAWKAPEWVALLIVGAFAIFHGYAHGKELPEAADPMAYSVGFVLSTGSIHIVGILFGMLFCRPFDGWIARGAGGVIAAIGMLFLVG